MGFSPSQAQWLVQFMRNLPGGAPAQPSDDEYAQAMAAQAEQAAAQAQMAPPYELQHDFGGYEAPPFHPWPPPGGY